MEKLSEHHNESGSDSSWSPSSSPRSTTSASSYQSTSTIGDRPRSSSRNNSLFSNAGDYPHQYGRESNLPPIERSLADKPSVSSPSSRSVVRMGLESMRAGLIERAWTNGVQGR